MGRKLSRIMHDAIGVILSSTGSSGYMSVGEGADHCLDLQQRSLFSA
jgi:hypothetical protein